MSDRDADRSSTTTLNAGRMGDLLASAGTIQSKQTGLLSPLATLPGKSRGHSPDQFAKALDAEDGPLIGLRKAGHFIAPTVENCLRRNS